MRISTIKNNFNQAANTYHAAAIAQKKAADYLVHTLIQNHANLSPSSVLDLGCGTGFMTEALVQRYPDANFILNDLAEAMLTHCQTKFAQHPFAYLQGDMDTINIPQVDLIVSNFCLQWSANIQICLERLYQSSKILAFNCLIDGSLKEWQARFPQQQLMHYPSAAEMGRLIHNLDPKASIFTKKISLQSPSPQAFIRHLKQIGATTPLEKTSLSHLKLILKSNTPIQTYYHVLFAIMEHHE